VTARADLGRFRAMVTVFRLLSLSAGIAAVAWTVDLLHRTQTLLERILP
jgi:hypothetical protein